MLCHASVSFGFAAEDSPFAILSEKQNTMMPAIAVAAKQLMELSAVPHGSAAVVTTTAAPEMHRHLSPGATAANTRVRSSSRTPERGRARSGSNPQVVVLSPPTVPTEEAAKKRRASSLAPPTTPPSPPRANAPDKFLGMVSKLQQQFDDLNRDKLRFESYVLKRL